MNKIKQPVSNHDMIFLQAYLEQVVSIENNCKDDFSFTEWYLHEKYSENEVTAIIKFFKESGFNCDCDLVNKID